MPPPEPPRRIRTGKRLHWPHQDRELSQVASGLMRGMSEAHRERRWPIVLTGGAGAGKTYAALCVGDSYCGTARYWTVADACRDLIDVQQNQPRDRWPVTEREWWEAVASVGLMILDELGARERVSDHHYDVVKGILDRREGKPLIVVSNNPLSEIERLYDSRIASRLRAGAVIEVKGKDRRVNR